MSECKVTVNVRNLNKDSPYVITDYYLHTSQHTLYKCTDSIQWVVKLSVSIGFQVNGNTKMKMETTGMR